MTHEQWFVRLLIQEYSILLLQSSADPLGQTVVVNDFFFCFNVS